MRTEQEQEAVRVLQTREDLSFQLIDNQLQPRSGGATVTGALLNKTLEPGTTVTIRVHFSGLDGAEIGTTDIRVQAPDAEVAQAFQADFSSNEEVLGYYYEVVSPN